jgi:hypothetical protein
MNILNMPRYVEDIIAIIVLVSGLVFQFYDSMDLPQEKEARENQ